jgi:LemA protein
MVWIVILGLVLLAAYSLYVSLISKRNTCREALSDIDVQLKKRADLIPNMLAMAKKFMEHETEIMTQLTELRTKTSQNVDPNNAEEIKQHFAAADQLSTKLSQFTITMENYPDLKSNQTMVEAMESLNEVEAQIAAARRFYNSAVTALNNSAQIFPSSLVARMVGVSAMPFYQGQASDTENIDVNKLLS